MITLYLNTIKTKAFYLSSISKEQKEALYKAKGQPSTTTAAKVFKELSKLWNIDCEGVLKIGLTTEAKGSNISEFVAHFKGKDTHPTGNVGDNREIHYRNYQVTLEEQRKNMHLIIICPDSTSSANSALRVMKEEYVILWETSKDGEIHKNLQELLKDKVCLVENI